MPPIEGKIAAIHQPGYLPWPGFFHKIYASDIFILLDHVSIARQNFTARVPVRTYTGQKYLRIPLKKHHPTTSIMDVFPANEDWVQSHLGMLKFYHKSPFFKQYFPWIEELLSRVNKSDNLASINSFLIVEICKLLEIKTPILNSSLMESEEKSAALMIELSKKAGATIYLSGTRAMNYQEPELFEQKGLTLVYQHFFEYMESTPYPQAQGDFMNGLTILDTLFNIGVNGIRDLLDGYEKKYPFRESI